MEPIITLSYPLVVLQSSSTPATSSLYSLNRTLPFIMEAETLLSFLFFYWLIRDDSAIICTLRVEYIQYRLKNSTVLKFKSLILAAVAGTRKMEGLTQCFFVICFIYGVRWLFPGFFPTYIIGTKHQHNHLKIGGLKNLDVKNTFQREISVPDFIIFFIV